VDVLAAHEDRNRSSMLRKLISLGLLTLKAQNVYHPSLAESPVDSNMEVTDQTITTMTVTISDTEKEK
jgi:hypothetical protein